MARKKTAPDQDRDWSELPDLPLLSVLSCLHSLADFFAFSAVCRAWRSLANTTAGGRLTSYPPLHLLPLLRSPRRRTYKPTWLTPPRCSLETPIDGTVSYRCMVSSAALPGFCIGSSFGNLIFLNRRRPLLADVFTGDEIQPPNLPNGRFYLYGFLTAPPSSPECRLILSGQESTLMCWRVGDEVWSEHPLGNHVMPPIHQLLVFRGRYIAMDFVGRLLTLNFSPQLSVEPWEDKLGRKQSPRPIPLTSYAHQLFDCGGELMLVSLVNSGQPFFVTIQVYRLDNSGASWVKVESLGDWSLFMDVMVRCPAYCVNSTRWGGRRNCIYLTGSGCDTWSIFPLDDTLIDCLTSESPFRVVHSDLKSWPSPHWVYPSSIPEAAEEVKIHPPEIQTDKD